MYFGWYSGPFEVQRGSAGRGRHGTCSAAVARPLHLPGCTGASGLCDQMNGVDAPAAPDAAPALRTCATATPDRTDPPGTQLQTAEHVDTPDTVVMTPPPAPSVPEAPETTMTRSAFNGKGRQCELVRSCPQCARRARLHLRLALRARPRRSRASLARDPLSHPRHMTVQRRCPVPTCCYTCSTLRTLPGTQISSHQALGS